MTGESKPSERPRADPLADKGPAKRFSWLPVIVLFGVFCTGFLPMWIKSARLSAELNRSEASLRLESIQLSLATAALDARRGDYEPARQGMVAFFNRVTAERERGLGSALPFSARSGLEPLLAQRDDVITLLARSDPASAERLAAIHSSFRKLLGR